MRLKLLFFCIPLLYIFISCDTNKKEEEEETVVIIEEKILPPVVEIYSNEELLQLKKKEKKRPTPKAAYPFDVPSVHKYTKKANEATRNYYRIITKVISDNLNIGSLFRSRQESNKMFVDVIKKNYGLKKLPTLTKEDFELSVSEQLKVWDEKHFDFVSLELENRRVVRVGDKYALADKNGKLITDLIYDEISIPSESRVAVKTQKGWTYIDLYGKQLMDQYFETASPFHKGMAIVKKTGERGRFLIDASGKKLGDNSEDDLAHHTNFLVLNVTNNGNPILLIADTDNKPLKYIEYGFLTNKGDDDNYAEFKENGLIVIRNKYFLDQKGRLVGYFGPRNNTVFKASEREADFYVNALGEFVDVYDTLASKDFMKYRVSDKSVYNFSTLTKRPKRRMPFLKKQLNANTFSIAEGGYEVLYDVKGNQMDEEKYTRTYVQEEEYGNDYIFLEKDTLVGLMYKRKKTLEVEFLDYREASKGYLICKKGNSYNIYSMKDGQKMLPESFEYITWSVSDNKYELRKNGTSASLSKDFSDYEKLDFSFEYAGFLFEDRKLIASKTDGGIKMGFTDAEENMVIVPQYEYAFPFKDGLAKVGNNYKFWYIDQDGKEVLKAKYESIARFGTDYFYEFKQDPKKKLNTLNIFDRNEKSIYKATNVKVLGYEHDVVVIGKRLKPKSYSDIEQIDFVDLKTGKTLYTAKGFEQYRVNADHFILEYPQSPEKIKHFQVLNNLPVKELYSSDIDLDNEVAENLKDPDGIVRRLSQSDYNYTAYINPIRKVFDLKNKKLLELPLHNISYYYKNNELFRISKNNLFGLLDPQGNIVKEVKFKEIRVEGPFIYYEDTKGKKWVESAEDFSLITDNVHSIINNADVMMEYVFKKENDKWVVQSLTDKKVYPVDEDFKMQETSSRIRIQMHRYLLSEFDEFTQIFDLEKQKLYKIKQKEDKYLSSLRTSNMFKFADKGSRNNFNLLNLDGDKITRKKYEKALGKLNNGAILVSYDNDDDDGYFYKFELIFPDEKVKPIDYIIENDNYIFETSFFIGSKGSGDRCILDNKGDLITNYPHEVKVRSTSKFKIKYPVYINNKRKELYAVVDLNEGLITDSDGYYDGI
ncbi:WG repeat-containing protein [Flammeovirga sp. SJP92]|uniref:WG repeat-containing protein n=1 Tax=Flammeovirga sp. SJP92 TaxID=1775430 RepID=UPI00078686B7|nr:WG repeat-containing protein [Flammeovirga sp. SJP92]KXX71055.1 hypothetical protein AVL50_10660 [Flammeovirga sp. SJP92]